MDKNLKERFKTLIRKEGFYIALFLCLCIIVTVGTISYKMSNNNEVNKAEDINKEVALNSDSNEKTINQIPNAERVENTADNGKENLDKTKAEKSTTVSTNNKVNFLNPVDGIETRKYSYPTPSATALTSVPIFACKFTPLMVL